ncbi:ATP-dependent Clp protease ATP-binding subunit [Treponema sp.]|uniref:ATP-dependent Clp protease ATP-binding subunit n=1 Tax=Treponema sp. TaxID=166 RepID=UPI00388E8CAE
MKGLSPKAQRLLTDSAQKEGRNSALAELLPEHVMLALIKDADNMAFNALKVLNINILSLQLLIEQTLSQFPRVPNPPAFSALPPSRRLRTLLDVAVIESRSLRSEYVGTEHLLLASIREENSAAFRFFQRASIPLDTVRNVIRDLQNENGGEDQSENREVEYANAKNNEQNSQKKKSFLAEFSRDLTDLAKKGELDPVIGRSTEIERIIQILSRRTKNNPILVGEPGVGKTSVAEGLAQRVASGEVPYNLLQKRVLLLDITAMVAGTKYRGDFEERMKRMMKEVKESGDIILFIDELHMIIGAGSPDGTMDASNILKPALSRGELQLVGATTFKEYRKHIEKDSALARRFQLVKINEPSNEETIQILNGLKSKYEEFHNVIYDEGSIEAIVKLSSRYIPEKYQPDKAIDLLDEAGSAKKITSESRPTELAELEKSIEDLSHEKEALVANQDYEKAAQIRDKVRDLKQKLDDFNNYWKNNAVTVKKHVTPQDIAHIISDMTGIPSQQLDSAEAGRLLDMEKEIHKDVIGQDEAVKYLSSAIRRSRAGVSSPNRPMGSFIFLGPTGVGKTQLAKAMAKFLFGTEDALIRIDMSDFMEKHTSSRLVGSAPGYVGYEEGGMLTNKVLQKPYSVVLFDEIEKAHNEVFNLLLQILEEGELSDNLGHTVNFRNTVIIMTSNAGARSITADKKLGFAQLDDGFLPPAEIKANAMEELKRIMAPELINRIDDIVVFNPLKREEISKILDIQIAELEGRLSEQNIHLVIKGKARDYLLDHGYEPSMGARPMRRLIQNEIEDQLANLILAGRVSENGEVEVCYEKEKLVVKTAKLRLPKKEKTALIEQ